MMYFQFVIQYCLFVYLPLYIYYSNHNLKGLILYPQPFTRMPEQSLYHTLILYLPILSFLRSTTSFHIILYLVYPLWQTNHWFYLAD